MTMRQYIFLLGVVLVIMFSGVFELNGQEPDPARIAEIAQMLPQKPFGLCRPISDRAAWAQLADKFGASIRAAEDLVKKPIPDQPDDLFLEFSRNGNRTRWQNVAGKRRGAIEPLVIAECIENKGRFLRKIEDYIKVLCSEPTWVMPAHDRGLENFNRKQVDMDLGSTMLAWDLATVDYLVGEKLDPEVRALLRKNLTERIIIPMRDMMTGKRKANWWLKTNNNWNAVCLAGVTGTAMEVLDSREDRALFVAAAELLIQNFLSGFTPDGYCSEGVGYWNYGFGHFVLLTEAIYQNTGGKLDLLMMKQARAPSLFGARIEIINDIYPAFADCGVGSKPSPEILRYVSLRLGLGLKRYEQLESMTVSGSLYGQMLVALGDSASKLKPADTAVETAGLRGWFPDAGILVCRPSEGGTNEFAVALKGGNNNEHHNHNDVGSYVVVLGNRVPVIDPGSEVYTARTFSSKRYESNVLNSFGHSVPVIAGKLQSSGKDARGEIIGTLFTDESDTIEFEMKSAYKVPSLQSLRRKFRYIRKGEGIFGVRDTVSFSSPETFENAIVTFGKWKQVDQRKLLIYDLDKAVEVTIVPRPNVELKFDSVELKEDLNARGVPTRIGIAFAEPVTNALLELQYRPVPSPVSPPEGELLANGGFEHGDLFWSLRDGCMGSIVTEPVKTGEGALRITDTSKTDGSNVSSASMVVEPEKEYVLSGSVLTESGGGLGIYVNFMDRNGGKLNERDAKGNEAPVKVINDTGKQWQEFEAVFKTPADTTKISVWLHTFSGSVATCCLDDLHIKLVEK